MNKKILTILAASILLTGLGFNTQTLAADHHRGDKAPHEKVYNNGGHFRKESPKHVVKGKPGRPDFNLKQTPGNKFKAKQQKKDIKAVKKQQKQNIKNRKNDHKYHNAGYNKGIKNGQKSFNRGPQKFKNNKMKHRQPARHR